MYLNQLNDEKLRSFKLVKLKYRRGWSSNSDVLHNWFFQEIRSFLFNLQKIQDSGKRIPESWKIYWNLINDQDSRSIKLLNLKYRRVEQIIQTFSKISSSEKWGSSFLICRNFKTLRKVLLNHAEYNET